MVVDGFCNYRLIFFGTATNISRVGVKFIIKVSSKVLSGTNLEGAQLLRDNLLVGAWEGGKGNFLLPEHRLLHLRH